MNICENCNNLHDGIYGSCRFCSTKCARGFSTKLKRIEINKAVSKKLKLSPEIIEQRIQEKNIAKHNSFIRDNEIYSILELNKRTTGKIIKRLKLGCFICGWFSEKVNCDIHHIIQRKDGGSNDHKNLTYLCPNCHRLVHAKVIESSSLVTLHDYLGDTWKEFYYAKANKLYKK